MSAPFPGPVGPGPVAPGGAHMGPPPQKNKTLMYVGIGCSVLAVLALACGGGFYACWSKLAEAKPYAHAFLADLREANYPSALQRMDGPYQSRHNVQSFQGAVAQVPALTTHTDATMNNFNTINGVTTVTGSLTTATGSVPIQLVMTKLEENWYIQSVTVNGQPLP